MWHRGFVHFGRSVFQKAIFVGVCKSAKNGVFGMRGQSPVGGGVNERETGPGCGDSPPWVLGTVPRGVGYEGAVEAAARRLGGYFLGSGAVPLFLPLLGNFGMNGLLVSS